MTTRFTIGGVPEHFNLPFYHLNEGHHLDAAGLRVSWQEYSTGTGHMLRDLRDGKLDMAILLTEGIVTDRHAGNTAQIIAQYVASPLRWGVHTHSAHPFDLKKGIDQHTRFAISRPKSGSHLMAYLYAQKFGMVLRDEQFVVVNNMPGAEEAMARGKADLFLWEKFTTKPLVDRGRFHLLDEIPTPWPPFMIVARQAVIESHSEQLDLLTRWLKRHTAELKANQNQTVREIAKRFGQREADVEQWFSQLRWEIKPARELDALENVERTLIDLGIIQPSIVS